MTDRRPNDIVELKNGDKPTIVPVKSPAERLREVLLRHRGERHLITIKGYPDPDSIGSAMAYEFIARQFGIESTILYFDDISHHENRALVKKLAVDMVRFDDGINLSDYQRMALVDAQIIDVPTAVLRLPMVSIVDHHKIQGELISEFIDIRDDAGATSSIYAEYLADGLAPMDASNPAVGRLASALLYGIRSDTDDYLHAREIDYRAAAYLAPHADHDLLLSISLQSVSPRTMDITQRAYANKVIADTFLLAGVGYVRDEDRDSIGQAADYLLRREGVDTVIVYGIVNNQFVDGSMRTRSDVVDPDRFLKDLFGVDAHGVAYGGGRADKGAFKIILGPFSQCSDRDLLWKTTQRTIEDLFFNKIGIARE
ncbi:MAG: DHH family phosphoesterase [Deltaproteobacteria bacterium]|nr:DHH family phosphoesterase [Deltaproteobacteria bacterium]